MWDTSFKNNYCKYYMSLETPPRTEVVEETEDESIKAVAERLGLIEANNPKKLT